MSGRGAGRQATPFEKVAVGKEVVIPLDGQKHCRLKAKKRKSGEPTYYVSLEKPSRKRLGRLYGSDKAAAVEFFQEMEQAVEERGAEAVLRLNSRWLALP